jgi:hypothetical protein
MGDINYNVATALKNASVVMKAFFSHGWLTFLLCAPGLLMRGSADAGSTNRGVWCWEIPGPYGLDYIVGTNAVQNAAVTQFKLWGIKHVYGYYGDQLNTSKGQTALAAWNTLLYNNGIDSQCLFSDDSWGTGDNDILIQMINFNNNQPLAAKFKGVHLDIEPWGLASWSTDNQYDDLVTLANDYQEVRTELNTNGESNVRVYADQADWLDSLTSINWPSAGVRDQWFTSNFTNLAGITLMAYDQPTYSRLVSVVSWQITNYPGLVRVGIDAGIGQTWSNLIAFVTVASQIESNYTDSAGVDIYDFQTFEEIVPPVISFGTVPALTKTGFNLMVQGTIGSNCVVQASTNLINWQMVTNFTSQNWLTYFTDLAITNHPNRFYLVNP